jgi:hypothetical protein
MAQIVQFHRTALIAMLRGAWSEFWIAAPRLDMEAVAILLPLLRRDGARVRVITNVTPESLADGQQDLMAVQTLRDLPGCEVRSLPGLASSVYAALDEGPALVTGVPLTMEGMEGEFARGILLPHAAEVTADLQRWWELAAPISDETWTNLVVLCSHRLESRTIGEEIARIGAFVRVSVRGTRRSRRLDPREFGVPEREWGRAVRPVEVALFKLDEVIRAREELEAILAERGVEWNGHYLVQRNFLERDWPRLFATRERHLRERLVSPEGRAGLKAQLSQARLELESFLGELYPRAVTGGLSAEEWVDQQATRVLAEAVTDAVLEESGLEFRVLTILPEDERSVEELSRLLNDPKLRSVQLTFHL